MCCLGWSPEEKPTLKGPLWWLKAKQHGDQVRPRGARGALRNKVAENICFPALELRRKRTRESSQWEIRIADPWKPGSGGCKGCWLACGDIPLQSASFPLSLPLSPRPQRSFVLVLCGSLRKGRIHSSPEKDRGQQLTRDMAIGGKT